MSKFRWAKLTYAEALVGDEMRTASVRHRQSYGAGARSSPTLKLRWAKYCGLHPPKPTNAKPTYAKASVGEGGERGIRTPGPVTVNGFQDRRIRPLCHLSGAKIGAPV